MTENMENGRRPRRSFTDEYKAEVIELCRTSGKSLVAVAQDVGLTRSAVWRWVAQAEIDAGRRPELTSEEHAELVSLRERNKTLREERDILRRATVLFAKETTTSSARR
jgi:transposase